MEYRSAREKFLGLSLESTRRSYYPQLKAQLEVTRANEKQLQLLIDSLPALISYVDVEERFVFVNRAYEKASGLTRDKIVGRRVETIIGRRNYRNMRAQIQAALNGRKVRSENWFSLGSGEDRWYGVSYVPDTGPRQVVNGFYALVLDLTEKKTRRGGKKPIWKLSCGSTRNSRRLGGLQVASLTISTTC